MAHLALAAALALLVALPGRADEPAADDATPPADEPATEPPAFEPELPLRATRLTGTQYRVELKTAFTNRASPEETSRTTLRGEIRPDQGPLLAFRVDVPWVDKNNDFAADPLWVGLGDVAVKGIFRIPHLGPVDLQPYLEAKLPTAADPKLGTGKLVAVPGVSGRHDLPWRVAGYPLVAGGELSANVSVAGDPARADVGYAALEAKVVGRLATSAGLEWMVKPSYDWARGGETAGVTELTGEWTPGDWRLGLKVGRRLWGGPVGGSYDDKVELAVRRAW